MKEFFRNFKKQRTVGLLNITGLSLGIMVCVVVGLWAINELSFDRFHKNGDRIYRIILNADIGGNPVKSSGTFRPFAEQAKEELPAVEDFCRIIVEEADIRIDNVLFTSVATFLSDPNIFSFFNFPLIEGTLEQVLSAPDRVVISQSAAAKYFAEQDPIGQIIKRDGLDFTVSGIMKDIPKNSSLQADFVFPFFGRKATSDWGNNDEYIAFLLLREGVKAETLEEPLTQLSYRKFEMFKNFGAIYTLEALKEMHFSSGMLMDHVVKGNKQLMMVFIVTALVILLISCINFTNLFVSTSFLRAKAIGIKKAHGAMKMQLMRDFYMETAGYGVIAICAGLALSAAIIPAFNDFTQSQLSLNFSSPFLYFFLAALLVFVVLLAGSFPAFYMTRFDVLETLAGKFKGKNMSFLQKSLVVIQFTASIALLIVVVFMQKQVNYILDYDLGFNKEHVMYVQSRQGFRRNYTTLEDEFLRDPSITAVARRNGNIMNWSNGWSIKRVPSDNIQPAIMDICWVSPNYFDFFEMKIIDGENPFFNEASPRTDALINEAAALLLGYENPVGEMFQSDGDDDSFFTIKGVVANVHTASLHQDVAPQIFFRGTDNNIWNSFVFFKISGNPQRSIAFIEQIWKEQEADYPFNYHFLDDSYRELYTAEMNAGKVFAFAMFIALIITVAGLFAMAYYVTQRRLREIALRKVHGATIRDIFVLLNKDFLLWVVIAFVIACPIAYYGLQKWFSSFAVKTSLNIWVFLMVGVIALLITLLTTGYQIWKVATANPVKFLKME